MPRPVVLAAWDPQEPIEAQIVEETLGRLAEIHWGHELTPDLRRELSPRVDVALVASWPDWMTEDLPRMKRLRFVQRLYAGVENLPLALLRDHRPRLRVAGASGSNAVAVAEHAMGLLLACAKRIVAQDAATRRGEFHQMDWVGDRLEGKRLLIIGYGSIGKEIARLARAFRMQVRALKRSGPFRAPVVGTLSALDRLLPESDVVAVAVPHTKETNRLLDARRLGLMRPDAILVNVARGKVIDQGALYHHLETHAAFRAGLDVWWSQPKAKERFRQEFPFERLPNVVLTPHSAGMYEGWRSDAVETAARNVARFLRGAKPENVARLGDYV